MFWGPLPCQMVTKLLADAERKATSD